MFQSHVRGCLKQGVPIYTLFYVLTAIKRNAVETLP